MAVKLLLMGNLSKAIPTVFECGDWLGKAMFSVVEDHSKDLMILNVFLLLVKDNQGRWMLK